VQHHAAAVDVGDAQVEQFAQAQAAAVGDLQQQALPPGRGGVELAEDFAGAEHARKLLGRLP